MSWFQSLFRPVEPPTDKQVRFARALGITVPPKMSKQAVSAAIDAKKASDPNGYGKASGLLATGSRRAGWIINGTSGETLSEGDKAWLKSPETLELIKSYKHWQKLTRNDEVYGLIAYRNHASKTVDVDVAIICDVDLDHDETGAVRVVVDASLPHAVRDDSTGFKVMEWGKSLGSEWFPVEDFLFWERLPASIGDLSGCIVDRHADASDRRLYKRYEAALEKGMALAKQKRLRYR
jgi:hypothetical protein